MVVGFSLTLRNGNSCFPERPFLWQLFYARPAEVPRADTDGDGLDRSMPHAPGYTVGHRAN